MRSIATLLGAFALALSSTAYALRPDSPGTTELFRFAPGDVVETHPSPGGRFLVHFTRAGVNAVPLLDADGSGVPDQVERVAAVYDEVLAFYQTELGYRAPLSDELISDNGGDDRFDVYLVDFAFSADGSFRVDDCGMGGAMPGQCIGYMVQENDFAGYGYPSIDYATRLLASHELFHAVQATYDSTEGSVVSEGTAVWASEAFDPSLGDLESFAHGYLEHPDRPIDRPLPGPVDPFSYGSAIFFRFLEERFDAALIREIWEAAETGDWFPGLDAALIVNHGSSFGDAFGDFVVWNLHTSSTADADSFYSNGASYPAVTTESVDLPHQATALRVFYASAQYFTAVPGSRLRTTAALTGDSAGLDLVLAVRRGRSIDVAIGTDVDTGGADQVVVVVINPAISGDSRRPGLCIGDDDEVAICSAMLQVGDAGVIEDDADVSDTGLASDAGAVRAARDACRCSAPGTPRGDRSGVLALAVVIALVSRRRSRAARAVRS